MEFDAKDLVKVAVDLVKNKTGKYSKNEMDTSVRNAFIDLLGTDKLDYTNFRRHKVEIFEILEDVLAQTITEGFATDFFDQFVEYRDVNFGDTQQFYVEDNTPIVVAKHAGNHWDIRAQKLNIGDTFTVATNGYTAGIMADFKRFLAGRIDWNAFIAKVAVAFADKLKQDVHDAFIASAEYLPAEFYHSATFAENDLLAIAAHVQAANQASDVVLAGTKVALSKLTNVDVLSDREKEGLNQNGMVSVWKGYRLLPITQSHKPGTFDFQIEDNRIFVMPSGPKPIKVVHEGRPFIKEVSDGTQNKDMSMEYDFIDNYGIATVFNSLYGQYQFA